MGKINGGHNFNIIADEVNLSGTTRAYSEENRVLIKTRMKEITRGIANMYNTEIELDYKDGYPPTINNINQSETVLEASKIVVGDKAGSPYLSMGGEDFSYYLQKVPGVLLLRGICSGQAKII